MDERAWRTGKSGADGAWASRAKEAGLITAWRSFEQQKASRWLWVQATPLVSEEDAVDSLRSVPQRMLRNVRADVTLVSSAEVEAVAVANASSGWACEQQTSSRRGAGLALYSAFVTGSTVVALAASGLAGSWTWTEVTALAQKQADRLGS